MRRFGLALSSPIKSEIQARLELEWTHSDPFIRIMDDNGHLHTVDSYLTELQRDPKHAIYFPDTSPSRISIEDEAKINANLEKIAKGEIAVVDDRS